MWGRRKKTPPLVPGRDRPRAEYGSRPTYSYYASGRPETPRSTRPVRQSAEQPQRKRHPFRLQRLIVLFYIGIAVVCIVKIMLVVPQSKVVVVSDDTLNQQLPTDMYAKTADELLRGSVLNMSKITLNTNGIANEVEQRYPELSSAVLAVPLLGNRPVLYVSPERPAFVLETQTAQYTIDSKGYVLSELIVPTQELVHLRESTNRTVKPGERYFAGSTVQFATTAVYQLQKANLAVEYVDFPIDKPYELDVYLKGHSYPVRFNLEADALQQSGAAIATLQKIGPGTPREYLDVRVPGRVYYK